MNDMKFNHTMNVMNYHAASVFLAGVYMYAVLYLLKEGCVPAPNVDLVELRVSYPNDVVVAHRIFPSAIRRTMGIR